MSNTLQRLEKGEERGTRQYIQGIGATECRWINKWRPMFSLELESVTSCGILYECM